MLSFAMSVALMLAVVGGSMHWAVRKERRRKDSQEAANARHH